MCLEAGGDLTCGPITSLHGGVFQQVLTQNDVSNQVSCFKDNEHTQTCPRESRACGLRVEPRRACAVSPVDSAHRPSPFLSSPHSGAACLQGLHGPRGEPLPRPERLLELAQTSPGTGKQRWGLCVGLLSPRDKEATNCRTRTPVKCADSFLVPESELHSIVSLFLEELCSHTAHAGCR